MRRLTTSVRAQTSQLAAIALNEKLAAMTKPSEILNAFAASGERFNGVNLATTISRLGRAHRAHHARICSSDEFRTLVRVVARQSQEVGFFHTRQFANMAHGFAKLQFHDSDIFRAISEALLLRSNDLRRVKAQELSSIAWAFATAGPVVAAESAPLFRALSNEIVRRGADNRSGQALSNFAWSCAKTGYASPSLFATLGDAVAERARRGTMSSQGLANTAWAFATLNDPATSALFAAIAPELARRAAAEALKPQELANVAWAYASAGVAAPELFAALAPAATVLARGNGGPRRFKSQERSILAWSFAKAKVRAPALFEALAGDIAAHAPAMGEQALVNAAWGFATAGVRAPALFESVASECARRAPQLKPQELSMAVWSFAKAGVSAPSLFRAIAEEAAPALGDRRPDSVPLRGTWRVLAMSPQDLANVSWAYATAAVDIPVLFGALGSVAARRAGEMSSLELTSTLWSLAMHSAESWDHEIEVMWATLHAKVKLKAAREGKETSALLSEGERQMLRQVRLTAALEAPHIELSALEDPTPPPPPRGVSTAAALHGGGTAGCQNSPWRRALKVVGRFS